MNSWSRRDVLALAAIMALSPLVAVSSFAQSPTSPSGVRVLARGLLTQNDFKCVGVFRTPNLNASTTSTALATAMRVVLSGVRQYFVYGTDVGANNDHILEYSEPTLSPCSTPIASANQASLMGWGGDWGAFPVYAPSVQAGSGSFTPGFDSSYVYAIDWDEAGSQLWQQWAGTYSTVPHGINAVAAATLNVANHTLKRRGCWGLTTPSRIPMTQISSGISFIPQWFNDAYLSGAKRLALGQGGHIGYTSSNSYGPTMFAIANPSDNDCTENYSAGTYTTLSQFPWNGNGPYCDSTVSRSIGCNTSAMAPTNPQPAQMAWTGYGEEYSGWSPYGGHGWFGHQVEYQSRWYDDGPKHGILVVMRVASGFFNQTVEAFPAPSFTTPGAELGEVAFTLGTLGTGDSDTLQLGDLLWVQTCVIGVDTGCVTANGSYTSEIRVTAINAGTKRVTGIVQSGDPSGSPYTPIVGGQVKFGCAYHYASPYCSRGVFRMQIYNPSEFADVILGAAAYSPLYASEFDITNLIPGFGSPAGNDGIVTKYHHGQINGLMFDYTNRRMVVSIFANPSSGVAFNVFYVIAVS